MTEQADVIKRILLKKIPRYWEGKKCILELKEADYHWKQMEWIGFYFEWAARQVLVRELGGGIGPRYGSVEFDYQNNGIWDFKAHPNQSNAWTYLNDVEAVDRCIMEKGHLAWVIAVGDVEYEETNEFKLWHDQLKGKTSRYEIERIRRGARSRKRKVAFSMENILIVEFRSIKEKDMALDSGWLRNNMQAGQRNANGSSRNPKYGINIELIRI